MVGALPLSAFDGPTQTKADSKKAGGIDGEEKKSDAAAEKDNKAADTATRMLDAGIAAYQAGNASQAIRAFNTVLRGGGLASPQIARALYYRGLSYRQKGKPGLAISDLTSAAWLKDGLSPTEKQEALSNRVAAYREAGIGDVPELDQSPTIAGADWQTAMSGSTTPAGGSSPPQATSPSPPPVYAAPPVYSAPPAPSAPAPAQTSSGSSSGGGVGGFFDSITSLFGGGSSSSNASQEQVTTSSIADPPGVAATWQTTQAVTASPPAPQAAPPPRPVPQAAPPPQMPPQAEALPWASPSAASPSAASPSAPRAAPPPQAAAPPRPAPAAAATAEFMTQVAAAPHVETPAAAAAEPAGKFHVQVAAVRTRSEAYALAVRLVAQYGSELGGRKPQVDDKVIGSMGTFYRVRLGPYASAEEPKHLCGSLRSSGFDCLVVAQ
jgi:tetratricopeptide (TPR) repeat protein